VINITEFEAGLTKSVPLQKPVVRPMILPVGDPKVGLLSNLEADILYLLVG
jgi:hypothetical protein